jgi:hypothetical protein
MADREFDVKGIDDRNRESPTYLTGDPTRGDITGEASLRREMEGQARSNDFVRPASKAVPGEDRKYSKFERVLQALGAPVAIGSALLSRALGQGQETDLDGLNDAIREYHSYGDVLRKAGSGNAVGLAGGLMLDIVLDPVNWASAGTTAIIPRLAHGAAKAGVPGLKAAAKSGVSMKAAKLASHLLPSYNLMRKGAGDAAEGTAARRIWDYGAAAAKEYDDTVGNSTLALLSKSETERRLPLEKLFDRTMESMRIADDTKEEIRKFVLYSPERHTAKMLKEEAAETAERAATMGGTGRVRVDLFDDGAMLHPAVQRQVERDHRAAQLAYDDLKGTLDGTGRKDGTKRYFSPEEHQAAVMAEVHTTHEVSDTLMDSLKTIMSRFESGDPEIAAQVAKLGDADRKDLKKFVDTFSSYNIGQDFYDRKLLKVLKSKPAREFLNAYSKYIAIFRPGVLSTNPASIANSGMGNITFASGAGIDITSKGLLDKTGKAARLLYMGDTSQLDSLFGGEMISALVQRNPKVFRQVMGFDARLITDRERYFQEIARRLADLGVGDDVQKELNGMRFMYESKLDDGAKKAGSVSPADVSKEIRRTIGPMGDPISAEIAPSSYLVNEVNFGVAHSMMEDMRAASKLDGPKGTMARAFLALYSTPMDLYSKSDQVAKVGMFSHLVKDGISEGELYRLAKRFKYLNPESVERVGGVWYRLRPEEALRVVDDIYMNYAAMPGFVRMMRSLPILGSPFVSFSYGYGTQFLKTMQANPAFFSKANYLLREAGGEKGPMERKSLEGQYYSYMDEAGMMKIPFFRENPVYLNFANGLPQYSFSLLDNPKRNYGEGWGDKIVKALDSNPFLLKDPFGSFLMTYVILPKLMSEAQDPFGNPLFREDQTTAERVGQGVASLAEPLIPKGPQILLGKVPNLPVISDDRVIPYLPSILRGDQNVLKGRSAQGYGTKGQETTREMLIRLSRQLGLPLHRMNINENNFEE